MAINKGKIKYFAYVRKSSEGDDRQALSIPAQRDKLIEKYGDLDIEFVEDKASAFKPYNRPAFTDMLERIKKGERTGLIAWHPDRLSRNEKDAGDLTYMVRMNVIEDLKLSTYHFENTPEGIWMLQMALSQSQYESAKKGRDVKRGLSKKAEMGIFPGHAPIGYMNDKFGEKGFKTVHVDPERFHIVRKIFDVMLTGEMTPNKILDKATNEWGLRTKHNKGLSRSNIYLLLRNPFYYGEFEYPVGSGKWHKGTHVPMITRDEYDRIQVLLGQKSGTRKKHHDIAYRGPIRCGSCGAMVTAENKIKRQKNGNIHYYTYYHCTRRKDPECKEPSIEKTVLEKQIIAELATLTIPEDFKNWALNRLREMNKQEMVDREKIFGSQRREYDACVRKIDNLIDMRANNELTEEEFKTRKQSLLSEKDRLNEYLKDTDKRVDNWLDVAEKGLNFAVKVSSVFVEAQRKGDIKTCQEIFSTLGSNLILKSKKLSICWDDLLFPIQTMSKEINAIKQRLEPIKNEEDKKDMEEIYSNNPIMLREQDSNLRPIA